MVPTHVDDTGPIVAFSLTEGGPGSAILKRLHLTHPELLLSTGAGRTALILMALTWGHPLSSYSSATERCCLPEVLGSSSCLRSQRARSKATRRARATIRRQRVLLSSLEEPVEAERIANA